MKTEFNTWPALGAAWNLEDDLVNTLEAHQALVVWVQLEETTHRPRAGYLLFPSRDIASRWLDEQYAWLPSVFQGSVRFVATPMGSRERVWDRDGYVTIGRLRERRNELRVDDVLRENLALVKMLGRAQKAAMAQPHAAARMVDSATALIEVAARDHAASGRRRKRPDPAAMAIRTVLERLARREKTRPKTAPTGHAAMVLRHRMILARAAVRIELERSPELQDGLAPIRKSLDELDGESSRQLLDRRKALLAGLNDGRVDVRLRTILTGREIAPDAA